MTATPESLLKAVVEAIRDHDLFNRHDPEGCKLTTNESEHCATITPAVEAYGRACRIEELRDTAECTCVWRDMEKTILHRQCDRCDRIAELEAEG